MSEPTAYLIDEADIRTGYGSIATQRLYRLEPTYPWVRPSGVTLVDHVVVSATTTPSGVETYIFAADENGVWTSSLEMPGSFAGELDHEMALNKLGYAAALRDDLVRQVLTSDIAIGPMTRDEDRTHRLSQGIESLYQAMCTTPGQS